MRRARRDYRSEPRRDAEHEGAAGVFVLGDLARDAALELARRPIVEVDAVDEELQVVREIELRAHVPPAEAALVEIERPAVAVVGEEVRVVLVRRRHVEPAALVVQRRAGRAIGLLQQRQDQHLVAARHPDAAVDQRQRAGEAEAVERRRQEVEAIGKRELDAVDVGGLGVDRRVDLEAIVGLAEEFVVRCRSSSAPG